MSRWNSASTPFGEPSDASTRIRTPYAGSQYGSRLIANDAACRARSVWPSASATPAASTAASTISTSSS